MRKFYDLVLVTFGVLLFAALWLPQVQIYVLQPYAVSLAIADFLCALILSIELIFHGKKRIWLLVGIAPGLYLPVVLAIGFAACFLKLTPECPIF